ncbi:hypothetical protein ASF98_06895 [Arthrobacter sp. Leaf337]|nr:hypothetical protein ASF98_06895 [Arthrobacter sp. Leaf337]
MGSGLFFRAALVWLVRLTLASELATLLPFPSAEHTQEWNSDPDGWDGAVEDWLRNVPPSSPISLELRG